MAFSVRRIVTGHDSSGKAIVATDEWLPGAVSPNRPHLSRCEIWSADKMPVDNSEGAAAEAQRKKVLNIAAKEPDTLDPHASTLGQSQAISRFMFRGLTRFATSKRFGMPPNHSTTAFCLFGPSSWSPTSVGPYQSMIAATRGFSFPGQRSSRPAAGVSIPVVSDRCPPAECPVVTMREVSSLYCSAFRNTQRSAQRASSTAAGASEVLPSR